jgi:murein DD-endopeptidase MepM/ murein hydrolase activator NlpD
VDRGRIALAVSAVLVAFGAPASRAEAGEWSPPVDGPVVRGYEPPQRPFGPQHLGLDFAARPGTPVRAAGDGVVAFAGLVGRSRAVALEHAGARRTTYAYLRRVAVRPGRPVRRGEVLGLSGGDGPGHRADVVHFGYRVNGQPQDPAPLFRAPPPRISLAPVDAPACRSKPRGGDSPSGYTGSQPGRPRLWPGARGYPPKKIHTPAGSIGVRP